ncbi:hypothetical protein [Streptomyces sp. NPDC000878]
MNTAADSIVGILVVVAIFVALALPSLIGLAHDRRIDRQLREAQQDRQARQASARPVITAQDVTRAA